MKQRRKPKPTFHLPGGLRRAMVSVDAERPADVQAAQRWIETNRSSLTFVSDDEGCGCCVHLWRIEGPAEIIATLPPDIAADSDWTRNRS